LLNEYEQMVNHVIEYGAGSNWKCWELEELHGVWVVYKLMVHNKGVDIAVCHKEEYLRHGLYGGHIEYFC